MTFADINKAMVQALTCAAYDITEERMTTFGNKLSDAHKEAIMCIAGAFSHIALKVKTGRVVCDMPTGGGKTLSVICWLAAVHQYKLTIGVTIAASQVEGLAKMVRDLRGMGVPAEMIGLVHSKAYCPKKAQAFLETGDYSILGDKFASEPVTEDNDQRPFLFVTHQRIRAATDDSSKETLITDYKGKKRELLIWDEVCLTSAPSVAPLRDIRAGVGALKGYLPEQKPGSELNLVVDYLDSCLTALEGELERQCDDSDPIAVILPALGEKELETYSKLAKNVLADDSVFYPAIEMLLEAAGQELRVARMGDLKSAVVKFRVTIPPSLNNMVILDAGHVVNRLVALDASIKRDDWFQKQADKGRHLKTYSDVVINYGQAKSGRVGIDHAFGKGLRETNGLASKIIGAIASIPLDQGVLIFTFKVKRSSKVNLPETIKRELTKVGIDPEAKLPNGKPRIQVLTWGKHASLNDYAYCSNVVFAGILRVKDETLISQAIGQTGDLCKPIDDMPSLEDIKLGDVCGVIYQALSRGSCRYSVEGKAMPMSVWMTNWDDKIKAELERVMPKVVWKDWDMGNTRDNSKAETIALQITAHLRGHLADKLSNRSIKAALGLGETSSDTFTRAVRLVEAPGWLRSGQSFVKSGTALSYGFQAEA
jgi:hypothetical protein